MAATDVPAHSHLECDFWISTFWWETVRQLILICLFWFHNDISDYKLRISQTVVSKEANVLSTSCIDVLCYSVSCILPVCPCSAAVPLHSHICGGGSSCRLCSGGRALPCFPPGTPHAWLLYLIRTQKKRQQVQIGPVRNWTQMVFLSEQQKCTQKRQRKWKILFRKPSHLFIQWRYTLIPSLEFLESFPACTGENLWSHMWNILTGTKFSKCDTWCALLLNCLNQTDCKWARAIFNPFQNRCLCAAHSHILICDSQLLE